MAVANFAELAAAARKVSVLSSTIQEGDSSSTPAWDIEMSNGRFLDNTTRVGRPEVTAGPTTAAAWSYSTHTERSIPHPVASTGDIRAAACSVPGNAQSGNPGGAPGLVIDVLCVQGGLATNTTSLQTTNLPTATLPTRAGGASGGAGVWAGVTLTTASSSTDYNITLTYTNSDGTASRAGVIETTSTLVDGVFQIMPFDGADTGVRSVQSAQLSAASGTGTFGIMLFRPLFLLPAGAGRWDFTHMGGWNTVIDDEAVLLMLVASDLMQTGQAQAWSMSFFEA